MDRVMAQERANLHGEDLATKDFVRAEIAAAEVRLTDKISRESAALRGEMVAMETRLVEKIMGMQRWMIGLGVTVALALIGMGVTILLALAG